MRHAEPCGDTDSRNLRLCEMFRESHSPNVQPLDIVRKDDCAVIARATRKSQCNHRHMGKQHPKRPFLKAWREHMGWTQERLANELGTSHSTVLRAEKQETGVDDATFERIAGAYGITVAELTANPKDQEKARQLHRLFTAVQQMDTEGVALIAGYAERLKPAS